tara:strand:+ start:2090 stop:2521 length:432 start_codon:yes stop_codon:yes gene_type:complete
MNLNKLKPALGSKKPKKRLGRGLGSGNGKTSGRGHKGQKSRSGGFHRIGFEGGQMPYHRRLPKRGFKSLTKKYKSQLRLSELEALTTEVVDLPALKKLGLVRGITKSVKVIFSGSITKKINLNGLIVTKGAKAAIEALGGSVK